MTSRVSARGLGELASQLSRRDRQVLEQVQTHRFLTTAQLQTLVFTEHVNAVAAAKATRQTLARLHSLKLMIRLERRIGGVRAGSAGYIWALGPVGDRIRQLDSGDGIRHRFAEPSTTFLEHTLAVADTHLQLITANRAGQLELLQVQTEPGCWRTYTSRAGVAVSVRPDLFAITGVGEFEACWFLEVDRATESIPHVLKTAKAYQTYRDTGIEQHRNGTFAKVVWIVPTGARADKLRTGLAQSRNLDPELFAVVQPDGLVALLGAEPG